MLRKDISIYCTVWRAGKCHGSKDSANQLRVDLSRIKDTKLLLVCTTLCFNCRQQAVMLSNTFSYGVTMVLRSKILR